MIVVTGASGQLGTAFRSRLGADARYVTRDRLDLTQPAKVAGVLEELQPRLLINCAAYTAVDAAETDEDTARAVNAESVAAMARWCSGSGARFVTFSTDYVFDGSASEPYTESSPTGPLSAYGRTKLAGEKMALTELPETLIVRTSWVISGTHPNFVATMLRLAASQELRVVDDQHGCPTVTTDLAAATIDAVEAGATGILHLTNQGPTTWFGLARAAVDLAGLDSDRIQPCGTSEFPRPAPRPANSVMASERLAGLGLEPLPSWQDSLPAVVADLRARFEI